MQTVFQFLMTMVLGTTQEQFEALKKRYSRKKKVNAKQQNISGKRAADIFKARKELEEVF